jgi:hypothetical protein
MKKIIFLILLVIALLFVVKKVNGAWNENRMSKTYDDNIEDHRINLVVIHDNEKDVDCYVVVPDFGIGGSVSMQCIKN